MLFLTKHVLSFYCVNVSLYKKTLIIVSFMALVGVVEKLILILVWSSCKICLYTLYRVYV